MSIKLTPASTAACNALFCLPEYPFEAFVFRRRNRQHAAVTERERKDKALAGLELPSAQVLGDKGLIAGVFAVLVEDQTPGCRLAVGGRFEAVTFRALVAGNWPGKNWSRPSTVP